MGNTNTNEKTVVAFKFEDLRVYQKSLGYNQWLFENLANAESPLQLKLSTEFYQSAMNISLNIAEGSYRPLNQFEQYLRMARTATRECVTYSYLAYSNQIFSEEVYNESRKMLLELIKMLCALLISIQKNQTKKALLPYGNEKNTEPEANFNNYPFN